MSTAKVVSSVFRNGLFTGKCAVVTGGATGIGKAITQELLHLGCNVMIASRNKERLSESASDMQRGAAPGQLSHMRCNIRSEPEVEELMSSTLRQFGRIDFLVNNAGGQFPSPADSISSKGWNAVIDTNLTGTFLCCKHAYGQWMESHGGAVVNIIADMWRGFPGMAHTGAARAGVHNLTQSLAIEWAPAGVRINAVAPGMINSPTAASNYSDTWNIFEAQKEHIPMKRTGTVDEVSAAVCLLLSPAAAFMSGETVRVDGGYGLYSTAGVKLTGDGEQLTDHPAWPAYTWDKDKPEQINPPKAKL